MTDQQRQQRIAATRKAMADWLAKPVEQRNADLREAGILDTRDRLSSRFGGPGDMTYKTP